MTAENMNYALVPFVLVIGLCVLYFAFWGRHWFKPGGTRITSPTAEEELEVKDVDSVDNIATI